MWHMEDMNLLATYEFDTYSRPWHIEVSPIADKFYVALAAGDGENGSSDAGVACIEYAIIDNQYYMNESWVTTSAEYGTLHGINIHSDCNDNYHVYSTGRTDGNIYKLTHKSYFLAAGFYGANEEGGFWFEEEATDELFLYSYNINQ